MTTPRVALRSLDHDIPKAVVKSEVNLFCAAIMKKTNAQTRSKYSIYKMLRD